MANTSPAISAAASSCIAGMAWRHCSSEQSQQVLSEMRTMTLNLEIEVWAPSPLVRQPVRSGR